MEVLMGDVHTVDLTISEALSYKFNKLREMTFASAMAGEVRIKAWLIAWMDGSSGYMWATPVITGPGPGQGITQQDVALSLHEVLTCPWGGMPDEFMIDNGGEFGCSRTQSSVSRPWPGVAVFGSAEAGPTPP